MLNLRKVTTVAALGVLISGAVWGTSLIRSVMKDEKMGVASDGLVPIGNIPAMDASAPKKTETATFALG